MRAIPKGFVRTYGDIDPLAPRLVGRILSQTHDLPWHCVVRADGTLPQGKKAPMRLTLARVRRNYPRPRRIVIRCVDLSGTRNVHRTIVARARGPQSEGRNSFALMLATVVSEWLIPILLVGVAAVFAYLGGWVVKRQDVERTIANDADELLEQAQKLAADQAAWSEEILGQIRHLSQTAGMRARRLGDEDINDRFKTAHLFLLDAALAFREGQRHWAGEAIANIRVGLDAFTAPPSLLPRGKPTKDRQRLFPTNADYIRLMQYGDDQAPDVLVLARWQTDHGVR